MTKKKYLMFLTFAVILLLLIIWIAVNNTALEINKINITDRNIPPDFDGYRIVQISDLHNAEFGNNNEKLINMLKQTDADIITITGDLVDSRRTDINIAIDFAKEAVKIAPVYYINGNHESRISEYEELKQGLIQKGVTILENESTELTIGNSKITLAGLTDPSFYNYSDNEISANINKRLVNILPDNYNYKILLAHKPEYFENYTGKVDLVLSGHAHGGQFRLPFIGGLIAPGQGLFPKYSEGMYTKDNTNMIVSRGIGNSIIPFRINNNPEIVIAELTKIADQ